MDNIQKLLVDNNASIVHFDVNEPVFIEGDSYKGLYYIIKGNVKVVRNAKNKMAMWFANSFQFIGLSSFFNNHGDYTFSAFAFGKSVDALYITSKDFNNLIANNPEFKKEVIQMLCDRIINIRDKVSEVKSQNIKQRFINSILLLISKEEMNNSQIVIPYSVDELSELAATSKQYIKKLVNEFQEKKLFEIEGDNIVIDVNRLNLIIP